MYGYRFNSFFKAPLSSGASAQAIGDIFDIDFTTLANLNDFTDNSDGSNTYTLTGNGLEITGTPTTSFGGSYILYDGWVTGLENWVFEMWVTVKSDPASFEGVTINVEADPSLGTLGARRKQAFVFLRNNGGSGDGQGYRYDNYSSDLTPNAFPASPLVAAVAPSVDDEYKITLTLSASGSSSVFNMDIENLTSPASNNGDLSYTFANTSGKLDMSSSKFGIGSTNGTHWVTRMKLSSTDQKNVDYIVIGDSMTSGYCSTTLADRWLDEVRAANPSLTFTKTAKQGDRPDTAVNKTAELQLINASKAIIMIGSNQVISEGDALTRVDFEAMTDVLEAAGISRSDMIIINVPPRGGNTAINTFNTWLSTEYSTATIIDVNAEFNNGSDAMSVTYDCGDGIHPNDAGQTWISGQVNLSV